jgi:hypothetical protein
MILILPSILFTQLINMYIQAGAELCQAQAQIGLTAEAELILMLSSMEAVLHLFKIVSDSTRVDLKMFC